ncbi:MAG: hypothetical protein HYW22_02835 [Candidatus Aenigmarchaeota archaeon]|nr:hypothetical protein [Candidatus Aenigmarchaeota archaeon]
MVFDYQKVSFVVLYDERHFVTYHGVYKCDWDGLNIDSRQDSVEWHPGYPREDIGEANWDRLMALPKIHHLEMVMDSIVREIGLELIIDLEYQKRISAK